MSQFGQIVFFPFLLIIVGRAGHVRSFKWQRVLIWSEKLLLEVRVEGLRSPSYDGIRIEKKQVELVNYYDEVYS